MLPIVSYLQPPLMYLIQILHSHFAVFPLSLTQTHTDTHRHTHSIISYHTHTLNHIIPYSISYHTTSYIIIALQPTTRSSRWLRTTHHHESHIAHRKLPMSRCVFVLQSTLSTARISLACIAALVLLPILPPPSLAGVEGPGSCSHIH